MGERCTLRRYRGVSALTALAVLVLVLTTGLPASAAGAVPPVVQRTAATVTTDPLPTVQIDGVVYSQVVVGNIVYAAGRFTSARPAGSAPGQNEVARSNLLVLRHPYGRVGDVVRAEAERPGEGAGGLGRP